MKYLPYIASALRLVSLAGLIVAIIDHEQQLYEIKEELKVVTPIWLRNKPTDTVGVLQKQRDALFGYSQEERT